MTTEDIKHLSDATARAMQVTWSEKQMVADSFLLSQRLITLCRLCYTLQLSKHVRESKKPQIATFLSMQESWFDW